MLTYSLWGPAPLILIKKQQTTSDPAGPAPYQTQSQNESFMLNEKLNWATMSCNLIFWKAMSWEEHLKKIVKRQQKKQLQHSFFSFIVWVMPEMLVSNI